MNKDNIKVFIGKSKKGIVLIVAAALLSQLLNIAQYVYTRKTVKEQTERKTTNDLREIQRVANLKTTVETAVQNAMGDVLANINEPDNFYSIVTRLVSRNRYIVGSTVAMTPCFYAQKDSLFAPFAYPEAGSSQPVTKLLPYDYTKLDWYAIPFKKDSAMWSEPYTDVGGSDLVVHTYSQPIHNSNGTVIGILTADVHFDQLADKKAPVYDAVDRVNIYGFILQLLGLILIAWIVWRYFDKLRQMNKLVMEMELIDKELQIAGDIQNAMLPNISSEDNAGHHLDMQVKIMQAPEVSADFYDYLYVGSQMVFCIGDVPGNNVKASLMMAVTRSAFHTAVSMNSKSQDISPAVIVTTMNKALNSISHNEMFATLFVGVLHIEDGRMTYCCAGNPAPVVIDSSASTSLLNVIPNIPVGVIADFAFEEQQFTLQEGSTLFLYNDGLYETINNKKEAYGRKRMLTRLESLIRTGCGTEKLLAKMAETLENYRGSEPQTDDVTMMVIKMTPAK